MQPATIPFASQTHQIPSDYFSFFDKTLNLNAIRCSKSTYCDQNKVSDDDDVDGAVEDEVDRLIKPYFDKLLSNRLPLFED